MLGHGTIVEVLAANAVGTQTSDEFIQTTGHLLAASPLRVERVFLSLQTLHPAFRARTYLWRKQTDQVLVEEWPHGLKNRPGYYDSPDFHVHRSCAEFRVRNPQEIRRPRCDPFEELKAQSYTDYLMVPLSFSDGTVNTLAIATKAPKGFPDEDLDRFRDMVDIFVVILERYAALETVASTLGTYLGRSASREILRGRIRAGQGELIDAAILFADLRDFTATSASLDPMGTVRLLNDYFDCLVGPIEQHQGQVLKFIGDAVLAFFPVLPTGPEPAPLGAVYAMRRRLTKLNQVRLGGGEPPIRHGLCLHFGRVLYGNVGSTERLDFTIIGQAVNIAARGVDATRTLDADYLFTGDFVKRFGQTGLAPLDTFDFRGVPESVELFTFASGSRDPKIAQISASE